jgi:UDP-N-acetyl-D-mannosaminuronate dehydrogenase
MCRPRLTFWECAKLGAHMAVAIASRRFPEIGIDVEERAVKRLNDRRAPVS